MMRKRRTDGPSERGEGSGSREPGPVSGRGGYQQKGGGQPQCGRGYNPQSQSQSQQGGRGYGLPPPQQQQYGGPRGGPPRGGYGRGGVPSTGLPQRQSVPELHQATSPSYQAVSSQPAPSEVSPSAPVQQFERLSIIEQGGPSQAIPSSSKAYKIPMRPGKGKAGKGCIVKANHFFAELPDKDLHHYDVKITPEVKSRGVNRAVMKALVNLYGVSDLGSRRPAYDGRSSLYTAGPFPFVKKEFKISLQDEEEGAGGQKRERAFTVVIKLAAKADLHQLGLFL